LGIYSTTQEFVYMRVLLLLRKLVIGVFLFAFCALLCGAQEGPSANTGPILFATHYGLRLHVKPQQRQFDAEAELTFRNNGETAVERVPLMLNRLLRVESASDDAGHPLPFTQQVVSMTDNEVWQVNHVLVQLPAPVARGQELRLTLRYRGTLAGYTEVMRYVQDRVDERYTLFRAETMPFPILGLASQESWARIYDAPFTYDVSAKVPKGYILACGGSATSEKVAEGDTEFTCSATEPQKQMSLSVARFKVLEDAPNNLRAYAMPEDAAAGANLLVEMKRARDFFTSYFGALQGNGGLTVIEVPEGWSSYAGTGFLCETSDTFKDRENMRVLFTKSRTDGMPHLLRNSAEHDGLMRHSQHISRRLHSVPCRAKRRTAMTWNAREVRLSELPGRTPGPPTSPSRSTANTTSGSTLTSKARGRSTFCTR
jgi:hypothetical protein